MTDTTGGCQCGVSDPACGCGAVHPVTPGGGGLTDTEREQWDVDPDEWPHTPPFHVFRILMDEDDNTWWRAGSGHGLNAYDAAIERVEEMEAAVKAEIELLRNESTAARIAGDFDVADAIWAGMKRLRAVLAGTNPPEDAE